MRVIYFLILALMIQTTSPAMAQSQSTFKRTTATILFSSIGGGVLGLSTLSFYGKPQEHTDNITTGVLIGFIAGLSYVMYDNYNQRTAISESQSEYIQKQLHAAAGEQKKRDPTSWPLFSLETSW